MSSKESLESFLKMLPRKVRVRLLDIVFRNHHDSRHEPREVTLDDIYPISLGNGSVASCNVQST